MKNDAIAQLKQFAPQIVTYFTKKNGHQHASFSYF